MSDADRWAPIETFPVDAFRIDNYAVEPVLVAATSYKDGTRGMFLAIWDVETEHFLVLQPDAKETTWCDTFCWEVTHWRDAPLYPEYGNTP